jgi:hypothetical protein
MRRLWVVLLIVTTVLLSSAGVAWSEPPGGQFCTLENTNNCRNY